MCIAYSYILKSVKQFTFIYFILVAKYVAVCTLSYNLMIGYFYKHNVISMSISSSTVCVATGNDTEIAYIIGV